MTVKLLLVASCASAALIAPEASSGRRAQTQTALPDVPLVAIASDAGVPRPLPAQGRWFLVHVQANCAPCEALLLRIQTDARAIAPRLVIVVSRSATTDVSKMMTGFAGLEPAAWFADQPGALSAALHIGELPLVLAMNDRLIQWTLGDVLTGTQQLRDVLTGWVTVPGEDTIKN